MKVTVHASMQSEPFLVNGTRVLSGDRHITILDIRQPHEDINNGITFILASPAQLRDLIMAMVEACEKVQAEEIAEQDAALRAKIHAVLDARVALKARGQAKKEYVPVPATDQELEAAGLPAPAPVSYADDDDEVPF